MKTIIHVNQHVIKSNNHNGKNESLEKQEETQIFHARFNPDNQYMVKVNYEGKEEEHRAFMMGDRYWTNHSTFIAPEYIISVEKFTPKTDD